MPVPRSRSRAYFGQTRSALASAAPSEASSMKARMRVAFRVCHLLF